VSKRVKMGRKDWYYITISNEMATALDNIVQEHGRRYGIFDKTQFIRMMLGDFIAKYDEYKSIPKAKQETETMGMTNEKALSILKELIDLKLKYAEKDAKEQLLELEERVRDLSDDNTKSRIIRTREPEKIY
jgi:hypothetical protein